MIMFLMKSLCPGASIIVIKYFGVSNFHRVMSIVIPLSLSAFSLSRIQAYLKEDFPMSLASFSYLSRILLSIPPHLKIKWPVVVDFPESTCPMTTMLMWVFCFLFIELFLSVVI